LKNIASGVSVGAVHRKRISVANRTIENKAPLFSISDL
jgi:hypothetical protein